MKMDFESLLKTSRPVVPDPGKYRRLNRIPFSNQAHRKTGKFSRQKALVMVACGLAGLALFTGSPTNLGSYDGTLEQNQVMDLLGTPTTVHSQVMGSTELEAPSGFDQEDVDELHQATVAGEYEITALLRTTIGSKSIWSLVTIIDVNGQRVEQGLTSRDHPSDEFDEDFVTLYRDHMEDLMKRVRNTPPSRTETVESDGYLFLMKVWRHAYPGLGEVEYAEGSPIRSLD